MTRFSHLLDHPGVVDLGHNGVEERIQLHGILVEVELDRAVVDLKVRHLLENHLELVVGVGDGAVSHHSVGGSVILVVLHVQVDGLLPVLMAFARLDELGKIQFAGIHPDEVHQLLGLVLGVENSQLGVHTDVRAFAAKAAVEQAHELLKVASALVRGDKIFKVISVHDDVHAGDFRAAELLRLHASQVDLPPCLGVVRFLRRFHSLSVLAQLHEARRQL
mmetsp:Transcript_85602/g.178839  ORF Transcript_85602/g.178839 Transcript_85602/m.178839 type:complete len:220 (-) Transcript_85602:2472-3131(-)